jgi:hypothetical protein
MGELHPSKSQRKLLVWFKVMLQVCSLPSSFNTFQDISEAEIARAFTHMVQERYIIVVTADDAINKADKDIVATDKAHDKYVLPPTNAELKNIERDKMIAEDKKLMDFTVKGLVNL